MIQQEKPIHPKYGFLLEIKGKPYFFDNFMV